nr:integrase, catalytic region, zinc finger, CCHC-type, peptidase aspartic, catalytic [Tanacetum cinerariifolium]
MARQCPKPKRRRDATWFRDKVLLVKAQGNGKNLNEEELEFLADPGVVEAKAILMANLSSYGLDVLSEYLLETQSAAVQDTNSSAQQDAMILYVFEQLSNQVASCNKFADFEKDINYLKQTISEQSKEKELLTKTFNVFKKESKEKKAKNIDTEIDLEKKVKELDNIVCKMGQSAQTKGHHIRPMLYDGNVISKQTNVISIADSEETLMLEEKSRSKMILKQSDPMVLEKKVNTKPINYAKLNRLSEDFGKYFVPQRELFDKQALHPNTDQSASSPVKIEAPQEFLSSMFDARHELCFLEFVSDMNTSSKSKSVKKTKKERKPTRNVFTKIGYIWRPTGGTFTLVENACPLTRIITTNKVPLKEPIPLELITQESVVTKVYTRRPKVVQIVLWYLDSECSKHMTGDRSQLTNFVHKFLGTVKFGNTHIVKIMRYGDYQIGNIIISMVYYVEGLGHSLFSFGQFCYSDLEVAFRKHKCFVRNLKGVDLLSGSQETNLYTLSIGDMMASSLLCLSSKASKNQIMVMVPTIHYKKGFYGRNFLGP